MQPLFLKWIDQALMESNFEVLLLKQCELLCHYPTGTTTNNNSINKNNSNMRMTMRRIMANPVKTIANDGPTPLTEIIF